MNKPEPTQLYDIHACFRYLSDKYEIECNDFMGYLGSGETNNGTVVYMSREQLEEWREQALEDDEDASNNLKCYELMLDEFGDGEGKLAVEFWW